MSAWFYRGAHLFLQGFHLSARIQTFGRERIPRTGPAIVAANHISHFDPTLIATRFWRPIDFIASSEFYGHPLFRAVLLGMNTLPIDRTRRDMVAVKESLKRLKQDRLLGIFVEGGIRHGGTSVLGGASLNAGSVALAQVAGAPIIPTIILGSDQLYQWRAWFRQPRIIIGFGTPFLPDVEASRNGLAQELEVRMKALAQELRERYAVTDREMPHSAQDRWAQG
jgi:1-acyl-sn-glycerol-3-phosphate acyltransferase